MDLEEEAMRTTVLSDAFALWKKSPGALPSFEDDKDPEFNLRRRVIQDLVDEGLAQADFGPDTVYNFKLTKAGRDLAKTL